MKRPLSVIGFTMLVSLMLLCLVDNVALTVTVCGLFALLSVIFALLRKKKQSSFLQTVCFCVAFSCVLLIGFEYFTYYPALELVGEKVNISAQVADYPVVSSNRVYVSARVKPENSNRKFKIRLSFPLNSKHDSELENIIESLEVGDTVSFEGTIYILGQSKAEIEQSFKSRKLFLGAYPTGKVTHEKAKHKSLSCYILRERRKTINQLRSSFDAKTASFGISVLLGDKTYLDDETYQNFKDAGVSHIMAVSGMHLSIWVGFLMSIALFFGLDRRKTAAFLLGFVFLVMSLSLFSGSVTRAGLMMVLYLLGFIFRKDPDSLNSLGFAAIIILLQNPFSCFNVSFLLSFSATLGIITVAPYFIRLAERKSEPESKNGLALKILHAALCSVVITLSASLFTYPILAVYFKRVSFLSVVSNLLLFPVVTPVIICFGLYVMFPFVPGVSALIRLFAKALSSYCIYSVGLVSKMKFAVVTFGREAALVFAVCCVLSCAIIYLFIRRKNRLNVVLSCILSALMIFGSVLYNDFVKYQNVELTVHNVSGGLCVSIESGGRTGLLFCECDDYHSSFIASELDNVDFAIITDCIRENMKLVSEADPKKVYLSAEEDGLPIGLKKKASNKTEINFAKTKIKIQDGVIYVRICDIIIAVTNNTAQNTDILITNNTDLVKDKSDSIVIFSSNEAPDHVISTADNGDITLTFGKNSRYRVRGENSWQYLMKSN